MKDAKAAFDKAREEAGKRGGAVDDAHLKRKLIDSLKSEAVDKAKVAREKAAESSRAKAQKREIKLSDSID